MPSYYDELLKLCGFEDGEIESERSRLEKAFDKLELVPLDFQEAQAWVKMNHDIDLMGVRKILRIWIKELVDLILAREEGKKIIFYGFPTIAGPAATIASSSDDIFCTCPDAILCITMGQIFNKLGKLLEAGEANGLPPGYALCSLQQVRAGGLAKGIIPVPDLALFSSYFCDMGSKADELFHEIYGHPAVYVDGCMDSRWGEFPGYLPERVDYLGNNIEKIFTAVRDVLGVEVTENDRREGATRGREVTGALNELVELMKVADPQPISIVTVELARRLTIGSTSQRILKEAPAAISLLNEEVKEKIAKGEGIVEKGAPRVMIFISHFSDPSIAHMVENSGLAIPFTWLVEVTAKTRKNIPFISGKILAEAEMARGQFHSNYGIASLAAEVARDTKVDGILWNYLFNCRPLSEPGLILKRFVESETGIPVLTLESDLADSRTYSAGALRTRVEAFAEMLRARKAD